MSYNILEGKIECALFSLDLWNLKGAFSISIILYQYICYSLLLFLRKISLGVSEREILNACAWSGLATSFIYEALQALLSHQEALTPTVFRLQAMPRIQEMDRRAIWYGVKVMARTHIPTSSRPGTLVSPTSSIGMGNEKNGEKVMSCTLECNLCNSLTVTGEEGWKSKKNTPVKESCSAYLETHFHFNSMCLFYIKWHVWQTLEGNTFWALSVLTID